MSTSPPPIVALTVPLTVFVAYDAPAPTPPPIAAPDESAVAIDVSEASTRRPGASMSAPSPTNAVVLLSRSLIVSEPTAPTNPPSARPMAYESTSSVVEAVTSSCVPGRTIAPR